MVRSCTGGVGRVLRPSDATKLDPPTNETPGIGCREFSCRPTMPTPFIHTSQFQSRDKSHVASIFSRFPVPAEAGIHRRAVALPNLVNGVLVPTRLIGFDHYRRHDAADAWSPLAASPQRQVRELLHEVDHQADDDEGSQKVLAWPDCGATKARRAALTDDVVVGFQPWP